MEGRKWEDLEMDCLVHVFQLLGLHDLILSVPLVCHSWYKASFSPFCWKFLDFSGINLDTCSPFAERFKRVYPFKCFSFTGILKIAIHRSRGSAVQLIFPDKGISSDDLVYVSEKCPMLKVLVLPQLKEEEEELIPGLIHKWKDLEWISMHFVWTSFKEIIIEIGKHCKNFIGLRIKGWVLNGEASAIVTWLPKVKYLNLNGSFLSNKNLLLILDCCKELEELHVKSCAGFTIDKRVLERASSLKIFDYRGSSLEENVVGWQI